MKETGLVVGLDEKGAMVKIERRSACGSCKGCRLGTSDETFMTIEVTNELGATVGDIVEVDMETTNVLLAAFIMYGIPLIALLSGVFFSYGLSRILKYTSDAIHMAFGLGFTVVAFFFIKMSEKNIKKSAKFKPTVSGVIGKNIL